MAAQIVAGQMSTLKHVRATTGRSFFQGQALRAAAPRAARSQRQLTTMRVSEQHLLTLAACQFQPIWSLAYLVSTRPFLSTFALARAVPI